MYSALVTTRGSQITVNQAATQAVLQEVNV